MQIERNIYMAGSKVTVHTHHVYHVMISSNVSEMQILLIGYHLSKS